MASRFEPPDVLVLGGGGILGEAWMTAVLSALAQASGWDPCTAAGWVGTSAGSIVAASLAAGRSPESAGGSMPEAEAEAAPDGAGPSAAAGAALNLGRAAGATIAAPVAALGLRTTAPGGALARRALLSRVPVGTHSLSGLARRVEEAGPAWEGLRIAAVDLGSGRRVVFGASDAPAASVGAAVEASCAIPGYFRPVSIGGRRYLDGGAWSPTNMDAAEVGRGTRVLCLNPTGSMGGGTAGAIGVVSRTAAAVEALALRRRGAHVTVVAPDRPTVEAIGGNLMNPGPRSQVAAAGSAQGQRLAR